MPRSTDVENTRWFQSDRFFTSNGSWFFTTRESANFGPFSYYSDALQALGRYLDTQCSVRQVRVHMSERERDDTFDADSVGELAEDVSSFTKLPKR